MNAGPSPSLQWLQGATEKRNLPDAVDLQITRLLVRKNGLDPDPALEATLLALAGACNAGSLCLSLEPSALQESLEIFFQNLGLAATGNQDPPKLAETFLQKQKRREYSALIGIPAQPKALIEFNNRLYFHRHFYAEKTLAEGLLRLRASGKTALDPSLTQAALREIAIENPSRPVDATRTDWQFTPRQKWALAAALREKVFLLSGGPGTGKTALTAALLQGLIRMRGFTPGRIRLCAPTGRAAQRLRESLGLHLNSLSSEDVDHKQVFTVETLHRLLGYHPPTGRFARHSGDPLEADLVILDEASMADVFILAALVDALRAGCTLILVGDADQLPSVAAGSVLHELLPENRNSSLDAETRDWIRACFPDLSSYPEPMASHGLPAVVLDRSHRSRQDILDFAAQVNSGKVEGVWEAVNGHGNGNRNRNVQRVAETDLIPRLRKYADELFFQKRLHGKTYIDWLGVFTREEHALGSEALQVLLEFLSQSRILAFTRHGALGCERINQRLRQQLQPLWDPQATPFRDGGFHGAPVMITQNDAASGLSNGETGLWLRHGKELAAYFLGLAGIRAFPAAFLPARELAFATTVHKSQGSEYDEALIVLPEAGNRILAREILYTAVTRARKSVSLFASESALREAVQNRMRRGGGLRDYFLS